jgi:hypothetical protein
LSGVGRFDGAGGSAYRWGKSICKTM